MTSLTSLLAGNPGRSARKASVRPSVTSVTAKGAIAHSRIARGSMSRQCSRRPTARNVGIRGTVSLAKPFRLPTNWLTLQWRRSALLCTQLLLWKGKTSGQQMCTASIPADHAHDGNWLGAIVGFPPHCDEELGACSVRHLRCRPHMMCQSTGLTPT